MQLKGYTIHDCKALQYHSPFFAVSDGAATRMVSDLANDRNTMIGRHPRDYTLWLCGVYDDNSGLFTPVQPLVHVSDVIALVRTDGQQLTMFPADNEQVGHTTNGFAKE